MVIDKEINGLRDDLGALSSIVVIAVIVAFVIVIVVAEITARVIVS